MQYEKLRLDWLVVVLGKINEIFFMNGGPTEQSPN